MCCVCDRFEADAFKSQYRNIWYFCSNSTWNNYGIIPDLEYQANIQYSIEATNFTQANQIKWAYNCFEFDSIAFSIWLCLCTRNVIWDQKHRVNVKQTIEKLWTEWGFDMSKTHWFAFVNRETMWGSVFGVLTVQIAQEKRFYVHIDIPFSIESFVETKCLITVNMNNKSRKPPQWTMTIVNDEKYTINSNYFILIIFLDPLNI